MLMFSVSFQFLWVFVSFPIWLCYSFLCRSCSSRLRGHANHVCIVSCVVMLMLSVSFRIVCVLLCPLTLSLLLAMHSLALYRHSKPPYETLSPRESREHQPQGPHNRRDGRGSELNDHEANKKPLRCNSNAFTASPRDACEDDLSRYFP